MRTPSGIGERFMKSENNFLDINGYVIVKCTFDIYSPFVRVVAFWLLYRCRNATVDYGFCHFIHVIPLNRTGFLHTPVHVHESDKTLCEY